ncbi:3'(2'),5'-bisphosphate nucleotidase CysQ family protein [Sunxiuqinia sp. A32]|uniref:3'(2'),5'-bisphosphate nucleotidase CysQ family protein n=1 Tax=Sunxiuqinia sp. A32 TaxID=3461496 RepID=UPI0040453881
MKLTDQDLTIICNHAIQAAEKAGQFIAEYSKHDVEVKNKVGDDTLASQVVTEVDVKSQGIILEELNAVSRKYDLAVLTEETPDDHSRFQKDYFWCIDPLDGTLAFIQSKPGFSVSIGLVSQSGEPQIGVIYDPAEKTLYHAIKGQGIFKNKKSWNPQPAQDKSNILTFVNDEGFLQNELYQPIIHELELIAEDMGFDKLAQVIDGGAAIDACWMLENQPACYFKFPKKQDGGGSLWDFAASACIVKEAGSWTGNFYGNQLDLNRKDSTFMNLEGVLYTSNKELALRIQKIYHKLH